MPEDVKDVFGHAIDLAQAGGKHQDAKAMTGVKTPKEDLDLINARLKAAKQDFEVWQAKQGAK